MTYEVLVTIAQEAADLRDQALLLEQGFQNSVNTAIHQRDTAVRMMQIELVQAERDMAQVQGVLRTAEERAAEAHAKTHSHTVEMDGRAGELAVLNAELEAKDARLQARPAPVHPTLDILTPALPLRPGSIRTAETEDVS